MRQPTRPNRRIDPVTDIRIVALDPAGYRRSPWKNGGGVTIDIADAYRAGAAPGDWGGMLWRFGRTTIATSAPFSDLSGFDRVQVVVAGRGLVLETPAGEIDLRAPFRPARFPGETPIVSRLEAGPVEVVNLIGAREAGRIDMQILTPDRPLELGAGTHVAYAPIGRVELSCGQRALILAEHHALRIEAAERAVARCALGTAVVASIGKLS
jgi:environmental stress-induced protein Ves